MRVRSWLLSVLAVAGLPVRPAPGAAAAAEVAVSSNEFGFDLYRALPKKPDNFAFSPASVSIALAMPWGGARGETAAQMARVLHLSGASNEVLPALGALLKQLNDPGRTAYTLRVANRLFAEKSYAFEKDYLARMAAFGAPTEAVDFRAAAEPARIRINAWVAKETADRIKNLLPPRSLDAETRLAIVNALYLLADWLQPFTRESTRPRPFHPEGGAPRDVPTMHQAARFAFAARDGVKVLEMPYVGSELAMVIVLPDERNGLAALEKTIDDQRLKTWIAALQPQQVSVALPKFTIDPPEPIDLVRELRALGMPDAFDRARADFTGMAAPPNPADRLFISQVFHKAFVRVDEKGTEAAAATAVLMQRVGAAPQKVQEFAADHPFLFLIRDVRSGLILFVGRVANPAVQA